MDNATIIRWIIIIIVGSLIIFWLEHQDDATRINEMQKEINKLNKTNIELQNRVNMLESENQKLKSDYVELKEETTTLLTKYLAQELFWDAIGAKELRLICGIAKITFGDQIPAANDLPC